MSPIIKAPRVAKTAPAGILPVSLKAVTEIIINRIPEKTNDANLLPGKSNPIGSAQVRKSRNRKVTMPAKGGLSVREEKNSPALTEHYRKQKLSRGPSRKGGLPRCPFLK